MFLSYCFFFCMKFHTLNMCFQRNHSTCKKISKLLYKVFKVVEYYLECCSYGLCIIVCDFYFGCYCIHTSPKLGENKQKKTRISLNVITKSVIINSEIHFYSNFYAVWIKRRREEKKMCRADDVANEWLNEWADEWMKIS